MAIVAPTYKNNTKTTHFLGELKNNNELHLVGECNDDAGEPVSVQILKTTTELKWPDIPRLVVRAGTRGLGGPFQFDCSFRTVLGVTVVHSNCEQNNLKKKQRKT